MGSSFARFRVWATWRQSWPGSRALSGRTTASTASARRSRRSDNRLPQDRPGRPPIAHAKLAVLGNICWTDEHPTGHVDDYVCSRLGGCGSSASFTYASRRSLEFGYWTEDEDLVGAVQQFLVGLIGASEDIDSAADAVDPELARVDYDDAAMAEAWADHQQAREDWAAEIGEDTDDDW
jgi:hypothetical protein